MNVCWPRVFLLLFTGFSRPEDTEEDYQGDGADEYQGDENYDDSYNDDESSKDISSQPDTNSNSNKNEKPAYLEQDNISKSANVTESIILICDVKNLKGKSDLLMY